METPVQIDIQGVEPRQDVRGAVRDHVAQIEQRFGRVTAGRVVLKAPGGHHRTGGLYKMSIRLVLPEGREVNITHVPDGDDRHGDLNFALDDAFRRARRQLQDQVDRMAGNVKTHART